ncbi:MAG: 50S ribosomal protein L18 [bacterium]|nr:50S ribosomal protein L18 [bacterium]
MRLTKRKNLNKQLRKARNRAKIFGSASTPRLSVFRSNHYTSVQLINDEKGLTIASASTRALHKGKAKLQKLAAAKELGGIIAAAAKKAGIASAIFNKGQYKYHGRVKAVAEGAREGGLAL